MRNATHEWLHVEKPTGLFSKAVAYSQLFYQPVHPKLKFLSRNVYLLSSRYSLLVVATGESFIN